MLAKMRSVLLTSLSFVLTGLVIGNAYYQKKQFYPSVVYITKSNPSMAVLYVQAFVFVILMGKFMRKLFFGQLRAAEMEHLIERSWYAVTETCLAFTVFRDDFSPRFVALFTLLLFLKCFHWLAEDRVDYMERSPVISFIFHTRVICLLSALGLLDLYFVNHAYYSTLLKGASVQLVFGFEYAILLTVVFMTFMKYILHTIDLQSENPWENKAVYLLYTELSMGLIKVVLYIVFMTIMIKVHTFPLFAIRPMYLAMRSFKKALHDVIMSRRAIRNMNQLYPDATAEELNSGDNVCIICREEMVTACKKLPCNHIFHTSCLRSWFQRQQTCPTCRLDVLRMPRPQPAPAPAPPQQPQVPPNFNNMFFDMNMWMQGGMPPPPAPPGGQPAQGQPPAASTASTSTPSPGTTSPVPPAFSSAPFSPTAMPPFFSPFNTPFMPSTGFPRPPPDLSQLSTEDLRAMEGNERANVQARLQWLQDIQALLDGAMLLINQYNTVASSLSVPRIGLNQAAPLPRSCTVTAGGRSSTTITSSLGKTGARPKSSTGFFPSTPVTQSKPSNKEDSEVKGASGYTPPKEEMIPAWVDPHEENHVDDLHEVRRRRLQKFSQSETKSEVPKTTSDNLDLD
ncbi:E3 ubiquitin-protein ligase synoviolin A-like [Liolophura sinensis]|uniref:E3 ubiquitin-protein ligase synoviolin A-like n=1 Tax=Liolophura sinensis TaxID=3198878 RepID=UPI003158F00A